jgi:hypothetical protein
MCLFWLDHGPIQHIEVLKCSIDLLNIESYRIKGYSSSRRGYMQNNDTDPMASRPLNFFPALYILALESTNLIFK